MVENHLARERSPYLQQHAYNPVDWYPWGAEALERARREEKPIFLSIGYSTCHWCHVMAHESFENEEIAYLLNQDFVSIKVDREERPDLDHLYMAAVQALTGQGGWPMTVFLTPELEPFYGGTYFPPDTRAGRPGLRQVLDQIADAWVHRRAETVRAAGTVGAFLREQASVAQDNADLSPEALLDLTRRAADRWKARYDAQRGGFGNAPKFPSPYTLLFLLRHADRERDDQALAMVCHTLDAMAAGGIHDQLGGGFHRYATDADWLVPHFEKMLYDQAGLALVYTEAWLRTRLPCYAAVARDTLDYVLRDLTHPEGGFYSAEDADSEGNEGTFYVWTAEEIEALLGPDAACKIAQAFSVTPQGNWEGRTILRRPHPPAPLTPELETLRARLRAAREERPRPHRDEKVIAAWNGLMIEALARAGQALEEPRYIAAAEQAVAFAQRMLWRDGRLMRHYRDGLADAPGFLDDHACLGSGLLALHEATRRPDHLAAAVSLGEEILRLFDRADGAFAFSGSDGEPLPAPVIDAYDGASISAHAAAVGFLQRLGQLTGEQRWIERAWRGISAFQDTLERAPEVHAGLLAVAGPR